ncbi:GMC family oxidoreductase N-terminal domain-containing protein [Xylophilus sp. GW821-FHT01B05]
MFDYIVVGAGSAGCVVANRLTADGKHSVALLEAGPSDRSGMYRHLTRIPMGMIALMRQTATHWAHELLVGDASKPERRVPSPRGRIAGGTSAINGMLYLRGHPEDYDAWAEAGNSGWSFKDVLPFFKCHENFEDGASTYHGSDGELRVEGIKDLHPLSASFIQSAVNAGYPFNGDMNGASIHGFGRHHLTMTRGERLTSARAFLHPAMERKNLHLMCNTVVQKLLIEDDHVVGVSVLRDGMMVDLRASKEVILCGGTMNSPQLLMLSGIGDAQELNAAGITVRHVLAGVGQNYQDHACALVSASERGHKSIGLTFAGAPSLANAPLKYLFRRKGVLAESVIQCGGFLNHDGQSKSPTIKLEFMPMLRTIGSVIPRQHGFNVFVALLRPASRGRLRLRSSLAADLPIIEPHFFEDPADMDVLIEGLRITRRILGQAPLAHQILDEIRPGRQVQSDVELRDYVQNNFGTTYHPVGTCKMGPSTDRGAVVDHRLRVHGLRGLRVADASIMPTIVCANTNAPSMMIGEKAASLVLDDVD